MIRRHRNHQARINRLFREQINPLKISDDVELYAKFSFRRVHILVIVDELQEAIEHPLKHGAASISSASDRLCL